MDFNQLKAFVILAQERNFSQAANRLNLTQPSLSARIKQLENSVGALLVDRSCRPITLTQQGVVFLEYAERALGILEAGVTTTKTMNAGMIGRVAIGCPNSLATYLMPAVITNFNQQYPQVELHIEAGASEMVVNRLLDGFYQMTFSAAFPQFTKIAHTQLRLHDEMVVAAAPNHPLVTKTELQLVDLWAFRLILIHWGRAFLAYVESLQKQSQMVGTTLQVPLASAIPMVQTTDSITFMPRRLTHVSGLISLNVPAFQFAWDVVLLTRSGWELSEIERAFMQETQQVWEQMTG